MSEEKPCPFCQEACEPGAFLQRHISFKHFNAAVKCEHCEKTFYQTKLDTYTGSRKFVVVGRWYHSEEDFQSHQEKDHSSSPSVPKEQPASSHGPFWCCDEDRGSEANLKIHKKYTHDSEKDGAVSEKSNETPPSISNRIAKKTDKPDVFDAEKWLKSRAAKKEENKKPKQSKSDEVRNKTIFFGM